MIRASQLGSGPARWLVLLLAAAGQTAAAQCPWSGGPSPAGPNPQSFDYIDGFAYDSGRDRVVWYKLGSTWEWDRTSWLLRASGGEPRQNCLVVYDSARGKTVRYGGNTSQPPYSADDTWEWDGQSWTLAAATGPGITNTVKIMLYDAFLHRVVQVRVGSSSPSEFWDWNGTAWTQRAGAGLPYGNGPIAYDTQRSRIVALWNTNTAIQQTWEYDSAGGAWILRQGSGPVSPYYRTLAFDPIRNRTISYGGVGPNPNGSTELGREVWEWDSNAGTWTLLSNARPDGFRSFGAYLDTARSRWTLMALKSSNSALEFWTYTAGLPGLLITHQPESLSLTPGQTAVFNITATGAGTLSYHWRRSGQFLEDGGNVSGSHTTSLTIGPVIRADEGVIDVQITDGCGQSLSRKGALGVYVPCYANCDESTTPPMLNANDFQCFLNGFAAGCFPHAPWGNCYINCDQSTSPPILNANDFQCFLNAYVAGCT